MIIATDMVNLMDFNSLALGIIIAINIAYSAIPKALLSELGIKPAATAPKKVPPTHPDTGNRIRPSMYWKVSISFLETATANISSVLKNDIKHFFTALNLGLTF